MQVMWVDHQSSPNNGSRLHFCKELADLSSYLIVTAVLKGIDTITSLPQTRRMFMLSLWIIQEWGLVIQNHPWWVELALRQLLLSGESVGERSSCFPSSRPHTILLFMKGLPALCLVGKMAVAFCWWRNIDDLCVETVAVCFRRHHCHLRGAPGAGPV